jgi:Fe-S cluster biogenesis protein NfuA
MMTKDDAKKKLRGSDNPSVAEVVELMSNMVASDSGEVSLEAYDERDGTVQLLYRRGVNEHCVTCEITDEMLAIFTEEALRTRGVNVSRVLVRSPSA